MKKRCSKCGIVKDVSEFYKNRSNKDGFTCHCGDCMLQASIKYGKTEHGRETRRRYNASKKAKQAKRKWQKSKRGKEMQRRKRIRDAKQIKARRVINNAVRDGKIPPARQLECKMCAERAEEYHHHLGYDKEHWFDIIPLCHRCHMIADGRTTA